MYFTVCSTAVSFTRFTVWFPFFGTPPFKLKFLMQSNFFAFKRPKGSMYRWYYQGRLSANEQHWKLLLYNHNHMSPTHFSDHSKRRCLLSSLAESVLAILYPHLYQCTLILIVIYLLRGICAVFKLESKFIFFYSHLKSQRWQCTITSTFPEG